jgi:hypothetical protein
MEAPMNSRIALVVNTISKNSDAWDMFFGRLERHIPEVFFSNKYVLYQLAETEV